ncbi:retrovirus-related pol polyprotein from transposon TNT 1-94, partial [Tanacetum coccineum]
YDWSDQAEEGPNFALMAYSSSISDLDVSNDSNCSKSCMETVKLLKSQNDQLLRDLEKSSLMVIGYKTGLESVEFQVGEITIRELRKKLEKVQKEKDSIHFNVDKFENASKSLNKIIECQIVDNWKKGLGNEKHNAVLHPYTGNFMPLTPDLSFTGLDEFVNECQIGNPQMDLQDQVVIDSGCSRHMTGNMSYLTNYKEIDEGYVAFGGNLKGGKITGKCTIKTVAERRNRILIEAARTMLADFKLPTNFWAEAVNTACYVQNRVLCPVTILNTIDHLGKFDVKADEGFFIGYSLNSKAFRVFNSRTRIVEENLHIRFNESTPNTVHSLIVLQTVDPPYSQDPKSSHDDGSKPSSDDEKKID